MNKKKTILYSHKDDVLKPNWWGLRCKKVCDKQAETVMEAALEVGEAPINSTSKKTNEAIIITKNIDVKVSYYKHNKNILKLDECQSYAKNK